MEAPPVSVATQGRSKLTKGISRQRTQAIRPSEKATPPLPYDSPPVAIASIAPAPTPKSTQAPLDRSSQFIRPADVHVPTRPKSKRDMLSDLIKSSRGSAKQSPTPPVETLKPSSTLEDQKESRRRKADLPEDIDRRPKKKSRRQKPQAQTVNPP